MKTQFNRNTISSLAPLLLFVIFTACVLSVLLTGANTYQTLLTRDQNTSQQRTTVQYLTTRVRQNDADSQILVGDFHEVPMDSFAIDAEISGNTLFLKEAFDGRTFYTRIYCHENYLRELFAESGLDFSPSDGEKILEIKDLSFSIQEDLLYIEITYPDAQTETLILQLRSGKEAST